MRTGEGDATGRRIVVAGHMCLDVIVAIPVVGSEGLAPLTPAPGALDVVGPATLAIGGCVGNTGVALHRLGAEVALVARIGDDTFGRVLAELVGSAVSSKAPRLIPTTGAATSYSIIHNRTGTDRAIQHFPGVNDAFVAADVPDETLAGAALLHVGYPPLMASLVADDAQELAGLLRRARELGLATSLDLADVRIDRPDRPAVAWPRVLERVLREVDVFLPSLDEARHLLGNGGGVESLLRRMLDLGVGVAGLKCGADGLLVATGTRERLAKIDGLDTDAWADRMLGSAVFETDVAGTTGAGDTTIAGFLFGLVAGMTPEDAVTAACAVGAASTEKPDGTSGIPSWAEIEDRLARGWRRRAPRPRAGWVQVADGLSVGPHDRGIGASAGRG